MPPCAVGVESEGAAIAGAGGAGGMSAAKPRPSARRLIVFILAQLSTPDMCLPIQYALTYPDRAASERVQTNLARLGSLTFEEPDLDRFPALALARKAGETGGTLPAVLNAANEVAVDAFCAHKITFQQIGEVVARTMERHQSASDPTLEQILAADAWARREAAS